MQYDFMVIAIAMVHADMSAYSNSLQRCKRRCNCVLRCSVRRRMRLLTVRRDLLVANDAESPLLLTVPWKLARKTPPTVIQQAKRQLELLRLWGALAMRYINHIISDIPANKSSARDKAAVAAAALGVLLGPVANHDVLSHAQHVPSSRRSKRTRITTTNTTNSKIRADAAPVPSDQRPAVAI